MERLCHGHDPCSGARGPPALLVTTTSLRVDTSGTVPSRRACLVECDHVMRCLASPPRHIPSGPRPVRRVPRAASALPALLAIALLLGQALPAFAAAQSTVSGQVFRDDNGHRSREHDEPALAGAVVHLTGKDGTRDVKT